MEQKTENGLPLGQIEDPEELKRRYRIFSDQTLERWVTLVVGPHREAIAAVLRERRGEADRR